MMEDNTISPEARLAQIEAERGPLKQQVSERKVKRLANNAEKRKARDSTVKHELSVLKQVQTVLYEYNRCPTTKKLGMNILDKISEIICEDDGIEIEASTSTGF